MSSIAQNIRRIRREKGLTQEELADRMHLTRQTISSWENERTSPDIDCLLAIAKELDVDVNELLYGKQKRKNESFSERTVKIWIYIAAIVIVLVILWVVLPFFRKENLRIYLRDDSKSLSLLWVALDYLFKGIASFMTGFTLLEIIRLYVCIRPVGKILRGIIFVMGVLLVIPVLGIFGRYIEVLISKESIPIFHYFGFFIFSKSGSFLLNYMFPFLSSVSINLSKKNKGDGDI